MTEIRTITTLVAKRNGIESVIAAYEKRLDQARADLAHINATIALSTVKDFESGKRVPIAATLGAMRAVLESRGISFVSHAGGGALGITFSKPSESAP